MPAPSRFVAWWTVVLLGLLFVVSFVDRLALALLVAPIQAELGLSDGEMGLLLGASFAVMYAVAGLPLSLWADRGNRKWLVTSGVMLWSALTVASGFAGSFAALLLCRLGVGLGEAALGPAAVSLIGDLFERRRRALALAVFVTLGALGAAGSFVIAAAVLSWAAQGVSLPLVGETSAWRTTLILVGAPGLVLGAVFLLTVREPARTGPPGPPPPLREGWRHFLSLLRTYGGLFGGMGLAAMVTFGTASWFPTFLGRAFGVTPQAAGYAFGAAALIGAVSGSFIGPLVADRLIKLGRRDGIVLTAMAGIALTAPFYLTAFNVSSFTTAVALGGCATFSLSVASQMPGVAVQLITPGRLKGLFTAVLAFGVNIVGLGLGPSVVAALSEGLFEGPRSLGGGLTVLTAVVLPVVFLLLWQARRPSARALAEAAEAGV